MPSTPPAAARPYRARVPNTDRVANTYSAYAGITDMHELVAHIARTHTARTISGTDCNCAWRSAWGMILTQQEPEALENRLLHLLGNASRGDAADIKAMCEVVRRDGLHVIMSRGGDAGRLVYRGNGPDTEQLLNRVAINVMKKSGVAAATAEQFFEPGELASAEDIERFVHAMGASSAVMQVESLSDPDLTTMALRRSDNAVINSLRPSPGDGTIPAARFIEALGTLPIARLFNAHFELLIPDALWQK